MYCNRCGKEIAESSTFCPFCGNVVGNVPANSKHAVQATQKKKDKSLIIVIVAVISVVVLAVGGICIKAVTDAITDGDVFDSVFSDDIGNIIKPGPGKGDKGVLPSPDKYFGGQLARLVDEDGYHISKDGSEVYTMGWKIQFKSDTEGLDAFIEYAELIGSGDYAVSLAKNWESTTSYIKKYYYIYECDGNDDPEQSFDNFTDSSKERRGDLIIDIQYNAQTGVSYLTLLFDKDYFTFVNNGKKYSGKLTDLSGQSSGGGSSSGSSGGSDYGSSLECSFCDGDGDCTNCDGYGYVYSINGKRDKNCYKCNTTGRCSHCNGTGKRYN